MDPMRRAAFLKAGRIIGGAAVAGATLGRQTDAIASEGFTSINSIGGTTASFQSDNSWEIRDRATKPLYEQLQKMELASRYKVNEGAYLNSLKSVSEHWKTSVYLDREKRRATAMETIHARIRKIQEAPMEKVQEFANSLLKELIG